jgi:hypothetical protein
LPYEALEMANVRIQTSLEDTEIEYFSSLDEFEKWYDQHLAAGRTVELLLEMLKLGGKI